ncbi:hypothetical protein R1flu_001954 [Riccia fluitans]|uniref:SURP motif domain-containing protein n=1 Tax=Riccia fluitans TaxID=41844 RepID=A0ABD1Y4R0_9MARC
MIGRAARLQRRRWSGPGKGGEKTERSNLKQPAAKRTVVRREPSGPDSSWKTEQQRVRESFNIQTCRNGIIDLPSVMPLRESLAPIELKQTQSPPRRQNLVPKPAKKTTPVLVRPSHNSAESPIRTRARAGACAATISTPTRRSGEAVRTPARAGAGGAAASTPTRSGEAIEPPAEIRCIVDKTAEFVAQNGLEFEQKILSNEKRNPKFNFLKSRDMYHLYYQRRILDFIEQAPSSEVSGDQVAASLRKLEVTEE